MKIFGAPRKYMQGPGILAVIGSELKALGDTAVLLADDMVMAVVGDEICGSCKAEDVACSAERFGGEITYAEINRLVEKLSGQAPGVIVAAGGGKTIDTGKLVARDLGSRFVSVPTIASNDSPTSHIAVVYDEDHVLVAVEQTQFNPDAVIVDTSVIAKAPLHLLTAGVGDALVKKFEVEQCIGAGGANVFGTASPRAALALARACYDTVREFTVPAYAELEAGAPGEAFENLVEACVLMSGLAFENGGLSISHGMTRGLSAVPSVANALHGYQVAYGLMVQFMLEGRDEAFMQDMREFYRQARLPQTLGELGAERGSNSNMRIIADLSAEAAHMKKFERPVSADDIAAAMTALENA